MANRAKREDETFAEYRENLREEERAIRQRRKGTMIHTSKVFVPIISEETGAPIPGAFNALPGVTAVKNPNGGNPGETHYVAQSAS